MRKIAVLAVTVLSLALTPSAFAEQPTQGINSFDRNEAGVGGGPHCHVVAASPQDQFDFIAVYPSHTGHLAAGNEVFLADPNCDGDPGL